MKKFEFSLERLKNYKEQILETNKNKLGILRAEHKELTFELERNIELIDLKSNELEYITLRGVTTADLVSRKRFISIKQQEGHSLRRLILLKEQEIEAQLEVVIEATKEVNTLEKLEEKQRAEHNYAETKANELFVEEYVTNRRARVEA